jgi:nicotinamidase-related amidase
MEQDIKKTALLVMDMQQGILANYPAAATATASIAKAIANARSKQIPVIYVVVGFRKGAPEVSVNNKSFSRAKEAFGATDMNEFMKVHPDIAPQESDVTVIKRRVSAFTGSDLEVILRAMNIQHLVLTGISTGGVILATLVEAADKDFRLTVLSDCCFDPDEEVHRVLTNKFFTKRGDVFTLEEWCNTKR